MILGFNMARLCNIDADTRLWEEQNKYGLQISNDEVPLDTSWNR